MMKHNNMKTHRSIGKHLLFAVMILFLFAVPICVSAETIDIRLSVSNGSDITQDMRNALNRAKSYRDGTFYNITIPAGSYRVSGSMVVYSNTTLNMSGVTLTKTGKDFNMFRSDDSRAYTQYWGPKNITFNGGTLDSNNYGMTIFRFCHGRDIKLQNVTFKNVKNSHHVEFAACANITVTGCTFENYSGKTTDNVEALQLDIMHPHHFSSYESYDETPNRDVTVTWCTFRNVQRGVGTHSAILGSYFDNITIAHNTFENIQGYAIETTNYKNSTISDNVIKDCGSGIQIRSMILDPKSFFVPSAGQFTVLQNTNVKVLNNTIDIPAKGYNVQSYGISLIGTKFDKDTKGLPANDYRLGGVTVSGNNVTLRCTGIGIRLQGTINSSISKNKITCNITASGYNGLGNGDGIQVENSEKNMITSNTVNNLVKKGYAKEMCGINVRTKSHECVIQNNTITGASLDGIRVSGSKKVTVSKNKASKSGRYDFMANGSEGKTTIVNFKSNTFKTQKLNNGATANGKTAI